MFAYHEVDRLPDADARMALVAPGVARSSTRRQRSSWSSTRQPAIRSSSRSTAACSGTRSTARRSPHATSRARGADHGGAQPALLKGRFEMAPDAEQRYLAAMADLGDGPVRSADVALRAGSKDRGSTSVLRESLLRKDLVYSPRRGLVDFTAPLFDGYLRAQHPLAEFHGRVATGSLGSSGFVCKAQTDLCGVDLQAGGRRLDPGFGVAAMFGGPPWRGPSAPTSHNLPRLMSISPSAFKTLDLYRGGRHGHRV